MQIAWGVAAVEVQMELWVAEPETRGCELALTLCTTKDMGAVAQPGERHSDTQQEMRTQQKEPRLPRVWMVGV